MGSVRRILLQGALDRREARVGCCAAGALAALILPSPAAPADWRLQGDLSQNFTFDDNIGLNTSDEVSDWGSTSTALGTIAVRGETGEARLRGRFDFTRFFEEGTLNSDDQFFFLDAFQRSERSRWTLTGDVFLDTTRTSQLEDTGTRILDNEPRRRFRINPGWTYDVTPADRLSVTAGFRREEFPTDRSDPTNPFENLIDNQLVSAGMGWGHLITPTTRVEGVLSGLHFNADTARTNVVGVLFGIEHAFTPRLRARVLAGPRGSSTEVKQGPDTGDTQDALGYLVDASLDYEPSETSTVRATVGKSTEPSSTGQLLDRTDLTFFVDYEIVKSLFLGAVVRYLTEEQLDSDGTSQRDYIAFEPGVRWEFTQDLELRSSYRFRRQVFDSTDEDGISNAFLVTLTYRTREWLPSR